MIDLEILRKAKPTCTIHTLKIQSEYANDILYNHKNFEVRKNDRKFKVGDLIEFKVIDSDNKEIEDNVYAIDYIYDGNIGLKKGYVVLSISFSDSLKNILKRCGR